MECPRCSVECILIGYSPIKDSIFRCPVCRRNYLVIVDVVEVTDEWFDTCCDRISHEQEVSQVVESPKGKEVIH